jgi:hypothetical protein
VETHPVAVSTSTVMANQARCARTQGATVIGKRIRVCADQPPVTG